MSAELNHTIVNCRDPSETSRFVAEILGLPEPKPFARFLVVELDNAVSLDFAETSGSIIPQHYAFLVPDDDFDDVFERMTERVDTYWADPGRTRAGEINRRDGGRGFYFEDADGHLLEVLTRPYGSGSG
jgi:catechol 2,3-dioxygenase-like lactoylglutathione lyase family enzyme